MKTIRAFISIFTLILVAVCWSNGSAKILVCSKAQKLVCNDLALNGTNGLFYEKNIIGLPQVDSLKLKLQEAENLAKQGKTEDASKIYNRMMESFPNEKEVVKQWLILNMKRTPTGEEEAIQLMNELGKLHPANTAIIFWRMFLEAEHGHNEDAMKDVEELIKLQPDTAVNWVAKGQILTELKRYDEASEAFNKATILDPKRGDVWGMKASVLARIGKFDEALIAANKGIELMPGHPAGIYNRACMYSLKGDKANALIDLKRAIEMNPGFKQHARTDEDFKSLFEDEDFKNLTK